MFRIFSVLAVVALLLLAMTLGLGIRVGDYNELYVSFVQAQDALRDAYQADDQAKLAAAQAEADRLYAQLAAPQQRARFHMLVAILASIVSMLVSSIGVTYFIGTSRWCKEVVDTYGLDADLATESVRLKRRCFAWAFVGMLTVLVIVAFGAASDPGTLRETTSQWVLWHFAAAFGGVAVILASFVIQGGYIQRNTQIVDQIVQQVRAVRQARGLEVNG